MTFKQGLKLARKYNLEQEFILSYKQFKTLFTSQAKAVDLALADWDIY